MRKYVDYYISRVFARNQIYEKSQPEIHDRSKQNLIPLQDLSGVTSKSPVQTSHRTSRNDH